MAAQCMQPLNYPMHGHACSGTWHRPWHAACAMALQWQSVAVSFAGKHQSCTLFCSCQPLPVFYCAALSAAQGFNGQQHHGSWIMHLWPRVYTAQTRRPNMSRWGPCRCRRQRLLERIPGLISGLHMLLLRSPSHGTFVWGTQ